MKICQIVDSHEYVNTNCYQHQLLRDLQRNFEHKLITLDSLTKIPDDCVILCTVKIRNVYKNIEKLTKHLGDRKVLFYDQDPWESFTDSATYPGGYSLVLKNLVNAEFIVTSKWWAKYVTSKGILTHFCRIWPLPEYCSVGKMFFDRSKSVCFRGILHPHRQLTINNLAILGQSVDVFPSEPNYVRWIEWLRAQRMFLHDESDLWSLEGLPVAKNCLMGKTVEIASQGCFVLRDDRSNEELTYYGLSNIPCIVTYSSYEHCVEQIKRINNLNPNHADELIKESVDMIRRTDGWSDLRKILTSHS